MNITIIEDGIEYPAILKNITTSTNSGLPSKSGFGYFNSNLANYKMGLGRTTLRFDEDEINQELSNKCFDIVINQYSCFDGRFSFHLNGPVE